MKRFWKLWAMSLGQKATEDKSDADTVAIIRSIIVGINILSAILLIINIIHKW